MADSSAAKRGRISDLERFKRVCAQIDLYAAHNREIFTRFVQLSLATVGGFVWLKTQDQQDRIDYLLPIARWIIPMLAAVTVVELLLNHIGWRGFRRAEAELLNRPDLLPSFPFSGRTEFFRAGISVIIAALAYTLLR